MVGDSSKLRSHLTRTSFGVASKKIYLIIGATKHVLAQINRPFVCQINEQFLTVCMIITRVIICPAFCKLFLLILLLFAPVSGQDAEQ